MSRTRCQNYECCETCINREFDPFECEDCDEGSNYIGEDDEEMKGVAPSDVDGEPDIQVFLRHMELAEAA